MADQPTFEWRKGNGSADCFHNGSMVAWIEPRPGYCDRGHWKVGCNLPDIDPDDGFPRYFMSRAVAVAETEAFLRWRMFKIFGESK